MVHPSAHVAVLAPSRRRAITTKQELAQQQRLPLCLLARSGCKRARNLIPIVSACVALCVCVVHVFQRKAHLTLLEEFHLLLRRFRLRTEYVVATKPNQRRHDVVAADGTDTRLVAVVMVVVVVVVVVVMVAVLLGTRV